MSAEMEKITLVLGASPNPDRYSYRAVRSLLSRKIPVIAIGKRDFVRDDLKIMKTLPEDIGSVHTIALYLNANNQKEYYDDILSLRPERIIFNPGTANTEFEELLRKKGIEVVNDCMLVMLSCGKF
jgi:predicted CoA-binding protein